MKEENNMQLHMYVTIVVYNTVYSSTARYTHAHMHAVQYHTSSTKAPVCSNLKLQNDDLLGLSSDGELLDGIDEAVTHYQLTLICATGDWNPVTGVVASFLVYCEVYTTSLWEGGEKSGDR